MPLKKKKQNNLKKLNKTRADFGAFLMELNYVHFVYK